MLTSDLFSLAMGASIAFGCFGDWWLLLVALAVAACALAALIIRGES